jgi:hypothetical protein
MLGLENKDLMPLEMNERLRLSCHDPGLSGAHHSDEVFSAGFPRSGMTAN